MNKGAAYNETFLLQKLSGGEESSFDELFYANWDKVYSTAMIMTKSHQMASDIAQDVFLSVWKNRHRMGDVQNFQGYLHNIVKFIVHKRLRRAKVEDAYTQYLSSAIKVRSSNAEPEEYLSLKQLQSNLQQGIAMLPPQQQRAFRLSREEGLTHVQISELMEVSTKTVKDYIVRALASLRPFVKRYGILIFLFHQV